MDATAEKSKKHWDDLDKALLVRELNAGLDWPAIAGRLGRSVPGCRRMAERLRSGEEDYPDFVTDRLAERPKPPRPAAETALIEQYRNLARQNAVIERMLAHIDPMMVTLIALAVDAGDLPAEYVRTVCPPELADMIFREANVIKEARRALPFPSRPEPGATGPLEPGSATARPGSAPATPGEAAPVDPGAAEGGEVAP